MMANSPPTLEANVLGVTETISKPIDAEKKRQSTANVPSILLKNVSFVDKVV